MNLEVHSIVYHIPASTTFLFYQNSNKPSYFLFSKQTDKSVVDSCKDTLSPFLFLKIPSLIFFKKRLKTELSLFSIDLELLSKFQATLIRRVNILKIYKYKTLCIEGLGYKFELKDNILSCTLGFSHVVNVHIPSAIAGVVQNYALLLSSTSVQLLNSYCFMLLKLKKFNLYRNKGIILKNYKPLKLKVLKKN